MKLDLYVFIRLQFSIVIIAISKYIFEASIQPQLAIIVIVYYI